MAGQALPRVGQDQAARYPASTSIPLAGYDGTMASTVRLPEDLYEQLRKRAFDSRVPQARLIEEGTRIRLAMTDAQAARLLADISQGQALISS
jgi:hypothetical protein